MRKYLTDTTAYICLLEVKNRKSQKMKKQKQTCTHKKYFYFSSPEPLGSQGELIVYPSSRRLSSVVRPSVRRRPQCSNIFFSTTTWPIKAKFYAEPPWEGGTKVYINGPGHMTKMAAMPIYGKNLKKSSYQEPEVL